MSNHKREETGQVKAGPDTNGTGDASAESTNPYQLLVENITDYAIYMLDPNGIVSNWNPGAQRFKGYKPAEIVGHHFRRFFTDEDRAKGLPGRILSTAAEEGRYESQGLRVRKDGSHFWAHVVVDTIRGHDGSLLGFAKITRDISEQRQQEERLNWLALHDPLTGLPNRITLCERLEDSVASNTPVIVLMLDLDGFKDVNDTLGHAAGDSVLKAAADRISACVKDLGTVGRLGGDEFAIILPDIADLNVATGLCDRLVSAFRLPLLWEGQETFLGLSIGIAVGPNHGESAEDLLANADLALYQAKVEPPKGYRIFEQSFRQIA